MGRAKPQQTGNADAFARRLLIAIAARGGAGRGSDVAVTKLDDATGQSRGQTSKITAGHRKKVPTGDVIHAYAKALRVSYRWLAFGEGEMDGENAESSIEDDLRASVERDALEDAIRYHRGLFSSATIQRVRARAEAEGVESRSPMEWGGVLMMEHMRELREQKDAVADLRRAEEASKEPAEKKRNIGS